MNPVIKDMCAYELGFGVFQLPDFMEILFLMDISNYVISTDLYFNVSDCVLGVCGLSGNHKQQY